MLFEVLVGKLEIKAADKDLGLGILEDHLLLWIIIVSFVFRLNNYVRIWLVDIRHRILSSYWVGLHILEGVELRELVFHAWYLVLLLLLLRLVSRLHVAPLWHSPLWWLDEVFG